jgi:DNA polymerase-3 subunit epsilon/ATP-dependent DNA helicase DinG
MDRIFVALDVETTGLEAGVDEVIEIAAVKFRDDEVLETFQQLVKPRHSLPLKIARLTGITDEMLADAPRFSAVAPSFATFVKSYPVVGHSVGFDLRMLQAQGMRFPQQSYDTFEMATLLMPEAPSYSLSTLASMLGIVHNEAHRALADSDATRQVFMHMVRRIEALSFNELGEIIKLTGQIQWPLRDLFSEVQRSKAKFAFVDEGRTTKDDDLSASNAKLRTQNSELLPLKPTGNAAPLDVQAVQQFFAPTGALGQAFHGYEQRPQQVSMAEEVANALNSGGRLMVEAGTGVGKSMAYLVPSAMYAAQRGERVVVSTNTINLQDQLFFKDIPDLQKIMGGRQSDDPAAEEQPFTAALLKGRGNYLCLQRYKQLRRSERLTEEEVRTLLKVQLWMPTTTTGDKAELMLMERENAAWGKINVTPDTCTGARCPDFRECYFFQARRKAEAAHIVVVNHALLLADLASEANVLPPYDHLVIDEAHNLEDVATDQLGFELDQARLLDFLDSLFQTGGASTTDGLFARLPNHFRESAATQSDMDKASEIARAMGPVVTRARERVYDCFNRLMAFMTREAEVSVYDPRLRLTAKVRNTPAWNEVEQAWENLDLQLLEIGRGLGKLEELLVNLKDAELLEYDTLLLRVQMLRRFAGEVRINIGYVITGSEEKQITWLTYDRQRETVALHAAPLSVAELLQANLFSQKATAVLASATLSVNNSFEYVEQRIGLEQPTERHLDSPFDYTQQALIYLPNDMPEPNHNGYQRALENTLIELCAATEGRALVLFTANNALRQTYRAIQEPLEDQGIAVLGQGIDGSRRSLIQRFKEFPRTVLLGTTSFWEGVDVVGDALSVLVIAKLPFSVPNDPVFAARSEGFQDAFHDYSVPQAILRFKQGFGRLIRSRNDRGIVVVLDKRVLSKKYGQQFLDSLPETLVRSGSTRHLPALAARFLGKPS